MEDVDNKEWVETSEEELLKNFISEDNNQDSDKNNFKKTFTTFSGTDALVCFDDVFIPEVGGINWEIFPGGHPIVRGVIKYIEFGEDPFKGTGMYVGGISHIDIIYENEFGITSMRTFDRVDIEKIVGEEDVEIVSPEKKIIWKAYKYVPMRRITREEFNKHRWKTIQ
jgi:hypothetical protein